MTLILSLNSARIILYIQIYILIVCLLYLYWFHPSNLDQTKDQTFHLTDEKIMIGKRLPWAFLVEIPSLKLTWP